MGEFGESFELFAGGSGVKRFGGEGHGLAEVFRVAGGDKRGGGVDEDDVAAGPFFAVEHGAGDGGVGFPVATAQVGGPGDADAEIVGVKFDAVQGAVADFKGERSGGGGDLVHAVVTVDDEAALEAELKESLRHEFCGERTPGADELGLGAGGIGERAEHVEDGAHLEFDADGLGVLHGGVKGGSEEETDAGFADALTHLRGVEGDFDAEGLEDVGAAALAGDGTVAVLGDAGSGSGGDEGGDGGDVEGALAVASGAAGVDDGAWAGVDWIDACAHGAGESGDLFSGFAADAEGGEEGGGLRRRGVAFQQEAHGLFCLCGVEGSFHGGVEKVEKGHRL